MAIKTRNHIAHRVYGDFYSLRRHEQLNPRLYWTVEKAYREIYWKTLSRIVGGGDIGEWLMVALKESRSWR